MSQYTFFYDNNSSCYCIIMIMHESKFQFFYNDKFTTLMSTLPPSLSHFLRGFGSSTYNTSNENNVIFLYVKVNGKFIFEIIRILQHFLFLFIHNNINSLAEKKKKKITTIVKKIFTNFIIKKICKKLFLIFFKIFYIKYFS